MRPSPLPRRPPKTYCKYNRRVPTSKTGFDWVETSKAALIPNKPRKSRYFLGPAFHKICDLSLPNARSPKTPAAEPPAQRAWAPHATSLRSTLTDTNPPPPPETYCKYNRRVPTSKTGFQGVETSKAALTKIKCDFEDFTCPKPRFSISISHRFSDFFL